MAFQNTALQATAFMLAGLTAATATMDWQQPLSRAPAKRVLYYQSLVTVTTTPASTPLSSTVTIDGPCVNFKRTLQYQAKAWCPQPIAESNSVTGSGFYASLSTAPNKTWPPRAASDLKQFEVPGPRLDTEWLRPFGRPIPLVRQQTRQPPFVYNPPAVDNNVVGMGWNVPFRGPLVKNPLYYQIDVRCDAVEVEAAAGTPLSTTVTIDGPRINFKRTLQYQALAFCPIPPAAAAYVAASTTTSAVTTRTLFYQSIVRIVAVPAVVVPYEQWWHQPLSRPAARPAVHAKPYQPFIPISAAPNLTTSIEWLQKWQGPPNYNPAPAGGSPFVPKAEIVERVTPDKWLMRWQGPPRYRPIKVQTPPFVPKEAVLENTQTPNKWLFRFQKAVPGRPVTHTKPFFGYPYQDVFLTGGPADEPERVVCVLASSRIAMVPELARVVEPLPGDTIISSNVFEDIPCAPFGNVAGLPIVQYVILLEDGSSRLLLENGTYLLLEDD